MGKHLPFILFVDNRAAVRKKCKSHTGHRRADINSSAGPMGKMLSWVTAFRIILGLFFVPVSNKWQIQTPSASWEAEHHLLGKCFYQANMQKTELWLPALGSAVPAGDSIAEMVGSPDFLLIGLGIPALSVLAAVNLTLLQTEISFANWARRDSLWGWRTCIPHVPTFKSFHLSKI